MIDKVILGTVQLGLTYGINNSEGKPTKEKSFAILREAFDSGISTLDTAEAYGNAVSIIGEFHKQTHKIFKVISKFKYSEGIDLTQKIESSLNTLGVQRLFAYLFHSFDDLQNQSLFKEVNHLKNKGLIEQMGVSIYTNDQFETAISLEEIDIIQLPYNLLDNCTKRGHLISKAKEAGKAIHTRSAFLQGLFFKSSQQFPSSLSPLISYIEQIKGIVKQKNLDLEELALGYCLQNPRIDGVLFGVETIEQLRRNLTSISRISKKQDAISEEIDKIDVKEIDLLNPVNWK